MYAITLHPSHDHTWREVGGPMGLVLDIAFCSFVLVVGLGMIVGTFLILLANSVTSPVLTSAATPAHSWLTLPAASPEASVTSEVGQLPAPPSF
jgi:hypothetical protein